MEPKKTIMIVDDKQEMVTTLEDILEDHGYTVVTALNGYQALECVKESSIDLALMDIKMPGINGVETYKEIKKLSPRTAVIMMTAFAVEDLVGEALREGAYAMIYKPFDLGKNLSMIKDCLFGPLILIVDDQQTARENFKDILSERGYRSITVGNGYDAIEKVKKQRYAVIFLDVVMPSLDGENTFREIKKLNLKAPVIMHSGYSVEEVLKRCLDDGAYAILGKPYEPEKVIGIIEEVMARQCKETNPHRSFS